MTGIDNSSYYRVSSYHDIAGMTELRGQAKADPDAAIREVASQFESMFLSMMLKSARDSMIEGGLFNSSGMSTYQDMFDKQIAVTVASQGGIGLADVITRQFQISRSVPDSKDSHGNGV